MRNSDNSMIGVVNLVLMTILVAGSHGSANAEFTFGTTTNVGPNVNSSYNDATPCISRDGLSLYFASTRPGGVEGHDLWVAARASITDEWSEPVHLGGAINSSAEDYGPTISNDELAIYFRSDRGGGLGAGDIWVSTRPSKGAAWPAAVNAGAGINSSSDECMPHISADGLELYFASRRDGGYGQDDLYVVTRPTTDSAWSDPVNLGPAVNSDQVDACPSISSDGLTLFFNSKRSGGYGSQDLYITTRLSTQDAWSAATNLGGAINTVYDEMIPSFWDEGSVIYFCSMAEGRPGALGGADLWQAQVLTAAKMPNLNGDGKVDMADFCRLARYWMQEEVSVDMAPRLAPDGRVDFRDLVVFTEYWLRDFRLMAHWKLDESEGFEVSDAVGGHNGFVTTQSPLWQPAGGRIGGALQLNGINDYVFINFDLNPAEGSFSVFAWVKTDTPGKAIISQAYLKVGRTIVLGSTWLGTDASDGTLVTTLMGSAYGPLKSDSVITDGRWHHVGLLYDLDGLCRSLYVDGLEVARDSSPVGGVSSAGSLYFGAGQALEAGSFFCGLIDDVRIYNVALSAAEIGELVR